MIKVKKVENPKTCLVQGRIELLGFVVSIMGITTAPKTLLEFINKTTDFFFIEQREKNHNKTVKTSWNSITCSKPGYFEKFFLIE